MKGKRWILEPDCIEVVDNQAKVNLFEVTGGWVIPVTFGPQEGTVTVNLRNVPGMKGNLLAEAYYPGTDKTAKVDLLPSQDGFRMEVITRRGCALVKVMKGE